MTHGSRRWIAIVELARAHRHALRSPFAPNSVPRAPAHTFNPHRAAWME
jgi:hypothetical protein